MYKYHCLNPISPVGMGQLDENYEKTENAEDADAFWSAVPRCMRWSSERT